MAAASVHTIPQTTSEHELGRLRAHIPEHRLAHLLQRLNDRLDQAAHAPQPETAQIELRIGVNRGHVTHVRADLDERLA